MKEIDYKKKYEDALERARFMTKQNPPAFDKNLISLVFPELKESEDEKIRKAIIHILKGETSYISKEDTDKYVAWLEKQGEKKSQGKSALEAIKEEKVDNANKVEPKFKVDDWITDGYRTWKVIKVQKLDYILQSQDGHTIDASVDRYFRLWTIKEAKDGDVLAADVIESHRSPFVGICKKQDGKLFDTYCFIGHDGKFYKGETGHVGEYVHPATKEQRELLFKKIAEEGYEWDVDKKELKKIEQKPAE